MTRLATLALLGYFGLSLLALAALAHHRAPFGEPPAQPIAFPHSIHAGRLGLDCQFCHVFAERSPQAGVPPVALCMSCHRTIALESPEVQKLHRHQGQGKPIAWNRVHALPAHVYFSHKRHLRAGVDCSACHGGVRQMERMRQVRSLEMGWCVNCHRANGAATDCAVCHQ